MSHCPNVLLLTKTKCRWIKLQSPSGTSLLSNRSLSFSQEMPETPKAIQDETNLLFFWESHGTKNYFKSVAQPKLFIATKQDQLVHMATGLPSNTDFQILENKPWQWSLLMCEVWTVRMYHVHEGVKSFTLSHLLSHALSLHNSKRMFTLCKRGSKV